MDISVKPEGFPRLGMAAPQFEAVTSHGRIRLSDFTGSWVVLFSHPADFTPVCTSEVISLANMHDKFKEINCSIIGLSVDSVYSHIAWIRNIEANFDIKINFPIIADTNKEVANMYGMIMPDQSKHETSRCVFIIDDKQKIRAMICYPLTTGRNIDELFRLVKALQLSDKKGIATPANWKPGDKVLVTPPLTQDLAEDRMRNKKVEKVDWYFGKKELEGN